MGGVVGGGDVCGVFPVGFGFMLVAEDAEAYDCVGDGVFGCGLVDELVEGWEVFGIEVGCFYSGGAELGELFCECGQVGGSAAG